MKTLTKNPQRKLQEKNRLKLQTTEINFNKNSMKKQNQQRRLHEEKQREKL